MVVVVVASPSLPLCRPTALVSGGRVFLLLVVMVGVVVVVAAAAAAAATAAAAASVIIVVYPCSILYFYPVNPCSVSAFALLFLRRYLFRIKLYAHRCGSSVRP